MNWNYFANPHPTQTGARWTPKKSLAWMMLLFSFGIAGASAQQTNVTATLSGTNAPSTVDLQIGTPTGEYNLTGSGTLGSFTLRVISASAAAPEPSSTCSGLYIPVVAGQGVLRTSDGSLLKLNLTGGSDCIDLVAQQAHCIRTFQTIGGTGRFKDAAGSVITLTMTVAPVVSPVIPFFTVTGDLTGSVFLVDTQDSPQNGQQ